MRDARLNELILLSLKISLFYVASAFAIFVCFHTQGTQKRVRTAHNVRTKGGEKMLTIRKINLKRGPRFFLLEDENELCYFDNLADVAIAHRFLNGGSLTAESEAEAIELLRRCDE